VTVDGDHVGDQAAAYALGALEPSEVVVVEAHLSRCHVCRQVVAEAREIADLLAYAVPVQAPPSSTRAVVMAAVAAEAEQMRSGRVGGWRAWPWRRSWRPAAALAGVPAVALLAFTLTMQQALHSERQQTTMLAPPATREAQLVSLLVSPQMTMVTLQPASQRAGGKGKLLLDEQQGRVLLVVNELPMLGEALTYRVWLCSETVQQPVGSFRVRQDGSATVELPLPRNVDPFRWVWVTIEPATSTLQPPGEIVLTATF
jgi:anti-sigma factor RsiW